MFCYYKNIYNKYSYILKNICFCFGDMGEKMTVDNLHAVWEGTFKPLFCEEHLSVIQTVRDGSELRYVNLDNAATTKPFKKVLETVLESLKEYGSVHRGAGLHSRISTERYERAREDILHLVGASKDSYAIFTKNTTDAISMAASLWAQKSGTVLVSDIEHSANLTPWINSGNEVVQYKTGQDVDVSQEVLQAFECRKNNRCIKLLTVTGASNVTGYKPPIYTLAKIAHDHGAMILVDACQLVQHEKISMSCSVDSSSDIDFIAFSGHKMYAPFGAGTLVGPKLFFDSVEPYQIGGGSMAYITNDLKIIRRNNVHDHESGTPNFIGALAMAESMNMLYNSIGIDNVKTYEHEIGSQLFHGLQSIPEITMFVPDGDRTVFPFTVKGIPSSLVAEILSHEYAVGIRAGHFCVFELARQLCGISKTVDDSISREVDAGITRNIPGLVRASLSIYNPPDDIDRLLKGVHEIVKNGFLHYAGKPYLQNEKTGVWFDPEE